MPNRQVFTHQVERAMLRSQIEERLLRNSTNELLLEPEPQETQPAANSQSEDSPFRIVPIQNQILPCPICHRSGRHTSRIYPDHEINTCIIDPKDHHSWRIDYKQVGREFYESTKEDMNQVVGLVNELQGIVNGFGSTWGKAVKQRDSQQIERMGRLLHFLRGLLDNSGETTLRETITEVGGKIEIVTASQFQQTIDGRLYIGARLFTRVEDATRASDYVLHQYFIRPRMALIPANELCGVDRYVLALPRDPRNDLEATFTVVARNWLENLPADEYPEPPTPTVSMIFPFPEAPEPEPEEPKVDRRKKNTPEEFKRNGYRGLAWCENHEDSLKKARYLRRETGVSVRAVVVNPNSDCPDPRHILMIPADTDVETAELLHLWLESPNNAGYETITLDSHNDVSCYVFKSGSQTFRGLLEAEDLLRARALAKRLKLELGVSFRCKQHPSKDNPRRRIIMVPIDLDTQTQNIIRVWLEEIGELCMSKIR